MAVYKNWAELMSVWLQMKDNAEIYFGDSKDVKMVWDGTNLQMIPVADDTGAFNIGNGTNDFDVKIYLGATSDYAAFDVGKKYLDLVNVQLYAPNLVTTATGAPPGLIYVNLNGYLIQAD